MADDVPVLYIGDTWTVQFQLVSDGVAFPAAGITVRAGIVDLGKQTLLVGPVVCDPAHELANVGAGRCVAVFPAAAIASAGLGTGPVLIEVNVDGHGTWLRRVMRIERRAIA